MICHSHNDYNRSIPLLSATSAGCVSFEANVFYSDDDVIIGHCSPKPGKTLAARYVKPLRAILDYNNGGSPGTNSLYQARPEQSVVLIIHFKTSDDKTLDAVVVALHPLREGGYLSQVASGKFFKKQVTIVATGNAPFDRINSGNGVPDRDVFFNAELQQWEPKYTSLNSYYASASFKQTVGNPGSVMACSQDQQSVVREQVHQAHAAGIKVRYGDLPGKYMWESLAELGNDGLNADNMYDTARLPRIS